MDLKQKVEARRLERELEQTQIKLQQEKSEREAKERRELEKNKLEIAEKKREIEAWRLHKSQQEAPASNKTNQAYKFEKESGSFAKAGEHIVNLRNDKDGNSSSQYGSWLAANGEDGMDAANDVSHEKVVQVENRQKEKSNLRELGKQLFEYKLASASTSARIGYYLTIFTSSLLLLLSIFLLLNGGIIGCVIFSVISVLLFALGRGSISSLQPDTD